MNFLHALFKRSSVEDLRSADEIRWFIVALVVNFCLLCYFYRSFKFILISWAVIYVFHGLSVARIRGEAIRVTEDQFPEIYQLLVEFSTKLEFDRIPEVYVVERPNVMNAFATRFITRNYVVLYSDLIEMAYDKDISALGFILGHELGHLCLRHVQRHSWTSYASIIPLLSQAHSRGCEKSADAVGRHLMPDGALRGICSLGAGRSHFERVNTHQYIAQNKHGQGIGEKLAQLVATHPFVPQRLKYLVYGVGEAE